MRVMILGAKGQLGRELAARYHQRAHVLPLDLPAFDIGDPAQVREAFANFPPDLVVNAAAYTDVDGAEANREAAFRVNVTGAFNAAAEAERVGARLVYYSTDFVFDGQSPDALAEGAPVGPESPLGVYGFTKYLGELASRRASRHLILRTAWLYGPGGNNFVEKILAAAASRPELRVVADETGCPTHTWDLAEATEALCDAEAVGLFHVVNTGACSRAEFAQAILRMADLPARVVSCRSREFPSLARRPARAVLDPAKYTQTTGRPLRGWIEALAHYMERRKAAE